MKTIYTAPTVAVYRQPLYSSLRKICFVIFFLSAALSAISQSQTGIENSNKNSKLKFNSPSLESGTAGADQATYRFPKVEGGIDATVRIVQRSSPLVKLVDIDMSNTGHDEAFQPQVTYGNNNNKVSGPAEWWMEFEVSFFEKQTNKPVQVTEFNVSGIDIDGNGHLIREYITFYGLKTYSFESNSLLTFSDIFETVGGVPTIVGKRYDGPTVNYINIDTNGTAVMVTNRYEKVNKFRIRVGAVASGASEAADRMYSIYFKSFNYISGVEASLPVKLLSFSASLQQQKALLNWQSAEEVLMSHYQIEKSSDGKSFAPVAMVFCDESQGGIKNYSYSDKLSSGVGGVVYYRMKMVDVDGKFTYSPVRLLNLNINTDNISLSTYPNPVQNSLQVTIPKSWERAQVSYEVFNNSGQLVKKTVSKLSGQTETIDISQLQAGLYTIKASNGSESAVSKIIKR